MFSASSTIKQAIARWLIPAFLLIALVVGVELITGWKTLLLPWREISALALLAAIALFLSSHLLRVFRWMRLFNGRTGQNAPLKPSFFTFEAAKKLFKLNALHTFTLNIFPFRSGELTFPVYIKRYFGISYVESTVALLCIRLIDLHVLLLVALLMSAVQFHSFFLGLLTTSWLVSIALYKPARRAAHWPIFRKIHESSREKLAAALEALPDSLTEFCLLYLLSIASWLTKLLAFTIIFLNFVEVTLSTAVLALISGDLSSSLPIHGVAGAGTYEGAIVLALKPLGIDAAEGLKAAVNVHLFLLAYTCAQAACALLITVRSAEHPQ